jgi:hypothetical protein
MVSALAPPADQMDGSRAVGGIGNAVQRGIQVAVEQRRDLDPADLEPTNGWHG